MKLGCKIIWAYCLLIAYASNYFLVSPEVIALFGFSTFSQCEFVNLYFPILFDFLL